MPGKNGNAVDVSLCENYASMRTIIAANTPLTYECGLIYGSPRRPLHQISSLGDRIVLLEENESGWHTFRNFVLGLELTVGWAWNQNSNFTLSGNYLLQLSRFTDRSTTCEVCVGRCILESILSFETISQKWGFLSLPRIEESAETYFR